MPRAIVVSRNRVAGITAVLGVAATLVAFATQLLALVLVVPGLAFVAAAAWFAWYRPHKRAVELDVAPDVVRADGAVLASRRMLRAADAARRPDGKWQVDLHRWIGTRTRVVVDDAEAARTMIATLGFDRRRGTSDFRVQRGSALSADGALGSVFVASVLAMIFYAFYGGPWWLALPVAALLHAIVVSWPMRLVVGADGVTIGRRFVPYSRIVGVGPGIAGAKELEIWLEGGKRIRLDTAQERLRTGLMQDPVRAALDEALQRAREGSTAGATTLLRGDRSVRDWIASLRAGGGGYRAAQLGDEDLLAIVTDATSPQEARVAAAVALAAQPERAPRLRVAADDVADPVVRRVALVALDDEAALEAELEAALRAK